MKHFYHYFLLILLNLYSPILFAQTTQKGCVKEYQEKAKKTPLSDVEIVVRNAGSTISDKNGLFTLDFRNSKPGDKIFYLRIEKLGYEVFNIEALNQWYISRNGIPFTLIMCQSSKFKQIRDAYSAISSVSYAQQQKTELATIEREKQEGRISEENFQKKVAEIRDFYEEQLDNLDTYIDRFARIDLSELSDQELKIIDLVQKGNIEEAIIAYEQMSYISRYVKECEDIGKLEDAKQRLIDIRTSKVDMRDSLYRSIRRQADTYLLAGGKHNIDKAQNLLKNCALSDTLNFDAVFNYAIFAYQQKNYKDAEKFFLTCTNITDDELFLTKIRLNLGTIYAYSHQFKKAESMMLAAKKNSELLSLLSEKHLLDLAMCQGNIGSMYRMMNDSKKAEHYLLEADSIYKKIYPLYPTNSKSHYAGNLMNLGILYRMSNEFLKSEQAYEKSLLLHKELVDSLPNKFKPNLAKCLQNMANLYYFKGDYDKSEYFFLEAKTNYLQVQQNNPYACVPELAMVYNGLGLLYKTIGRTKESLTLYKKSLSLFETLNTKSYDSYKYDYARLLSNLGMLHHSLKKNDDALFYLEKAYSIFKSAPDEVYEAFKIDVSKIQFNLAELYAANKQFEIAIPLYEESQNFINAYLGDTDNTELKTLLPVVQLKLALLYVDDHPQKAEPLFLSALPILKNLFLTQPEDYRILYAICLYSLVKINGDIIESDNSAFEKVYKYLPQAYKQFKILNSSNPQEYGEIFSFLKKLMEVVNLPL